MKEHRILNFSADPLKTTIVTTAGSGDHFLLEDPEDVTGIFPDVIRALSSAINFTASFYQRLDGDYGVEEDNGSFSGIIGSLIRVSMRCVINYCCSGVIANNP